MPQKHKRCKRKKNRSNRNQIKIKNIEIFDMYIHQQEFSKHPKGY